MMNFAADYKQVQNKDINPKNTKYDIYISGTTNSTKIFKAPSVISKGHYYRIEEGVKDKLTMIVDRNNTYIEPTYENDETIRGVE